MKPIEDTTISCPYCGEKISIEIDATGGMNQDFYEECPVCCRPIEIVAKRDYEGNLSLIIKSEDDV